VPNYSHALSVIPLPSSNLLKEQETAAYE